MQSVIDKKPHEAISFTMIFTFVVADNKKKNKKKRIMKRFANNYVERLNKNLAVKKTCRILSFFFIKFYALSFII